MTQTARVYGGSLYDLAAEEHREDVILEQMQQIRQIFGEHPDYLHLLKEPSISLQERKELMETAFGSKTERYLVNFIKMLCERSLLGEFSGCCEEFTRRYNKEHGIVEAVVTSAVAPGDAQLQALKQKLEQVTGKRISLISKLDPGVVAGLRVEIEGRQIDGTVAGRLSGLSKKLREIIV